MRLLLLVITILAFVPGCRDSQNVAGDGSNVHVGMSTTNILIPSAVDYGNGVYYFQYTQSDFGNALSHFIENHPELELVSFAPDDSTGYGWTTGYFAVFRTKPEPER